MERSDLVRPLVDGAAYFRRLLEELTGCGVGDQVYFAAWRGDPAQRPEIAQHHRGRRRPAAVRPAATAALRSAHRAAAADLPEQGAVLPVRTAGRAQHRLGYRKALRRAERTIYVEDQFLWSPIVARVFADALARVADGLDGWHAGGRTGPRPTGRVRRHATPEVSRRTRWWAPLAIRAVLDPDGRPLGAWVRRRW